MGIPGERCYYPTEELVWDASHDSSPRSLRTCLAALYGLSPDSLLLAKHQPDKHTWEEISNWVRLDESFVVFLGLGVGRHMYTSTLNHSVQSFHQEAFFSSISKFCSFIVTLSVSDVSYFFNFQSQQVSKKKKKKKAESLLGAPFHLKDGDTIGIKVFTKPCLF